MTEATTCFFLFLIRRNNKNKEDLRSLKLITTNLIGSTYNSIKNKDCN